MRLFLIGFMGSGKSYFGKQLANILSQAFIDLDDVIVQQQKRSIPDIFSTAGEAAFRKYEQAALHSIYTSEATVIAAGGGTPCFFDNMDWMNQAGTTLYLEASVSLLVHRLQGQTEERPLLAQKSPYELEAFLQKKLQERIEFYQQAQFTFQQTSTSSINDLLAFLQLHCPQIVKLG